MLLIRKKLLPLIKSNLKIFLSLTLVSMIGIGFFSTLGGTYSLLLNKIEDYVEDYGYPDIILTTQIADKQSIASALSELDEAALINYRCTLDVSIKKEDGRIVVGRFVTHDETDKWQLYIMQEGKREETIEVYPNYLFIKKNGLELGDVMKVILPQGEKEICISKFVSAPECLLMMRNRFLAFDDTDFGYFYIKRHNFTELFGISEEMTNQVFIYTSEGADKERVLEQAREKLNDIGVIDAYTYENSSVKQGISHNLDQIATLSSWLPPIFMAAMLIFLYLSIAQMVKENRTQIGVLEALGFSMRQITGLFCSFVFLSIAIAAAFGTLIGSELTNLVVGVFADTLIIPSAEANHNILLTLVLIVLTLFTGEAAALIACRRIAEIKPADAMRSLSPISGEPPFLIQKMFKKTAELKKIILSEVLRNKGRFLLSIVCITLATLLIFLGGSFWVSKDYMFNNLFEERLLYDAQLYFNTPVSDEKFEKISAMDEVTSAEKIAISECLLKYGEEEEIVLLNGLTDNSSMINVFGTDFKQIVVPKKGVIIEEELSKRLHIHEGDMVELNSIPVEVAGISNQNLLFAQYCSMEQMQEIIGTDDIVNSILCNLVSSDAEISFNTKMTEDNNFYSTMFKRLIYDNLKLNFTMFNLAIYIVILSAVLIGFTIIYNMALINLTERKREYSVLLVNGFSIGQITKNVLLEVFTQYIAAMVISFAAGTSMMKLFLSNMSTSTLAYPYANNWVTYLVFAGIILVVVAGANLSAMHQMSKFDLSDCLKERE